MPFSSTARQHDTHQSLNDNLTKLSRSFPSPWSMSQELDPRTRQHIRGKLPQRPEATHLCEIARMNAFWQCVFLLPPITYWPLELTTSVNQGTIRTPVKLSFLILFTVFTPPRLKLYFHIAWDSFSLSLLLVAGSTQVGVSKKPRQKNTITLRALPCVRFQ